MASSEEIAKELSAIQTALESFEDGASIEDIQSALKTPIELRTLQRRLDTLRTQGVVERSGRSRATVYSLVRKSAGQDKQETDLIPLSKEGKRIRDLVTQPIQARR